MNHNELQTVDNYTVGSKIKGIKLVHAWNPREFGTLSAKFDNMKVLMDALGETFDVTLEDSYRIVQDIIGSNKDVDSQFFREAGKEHRPTYTIKQQNSVWSRIKSFFGR